MIGWTARELARLTGVPVPTLISWIRTGLVNPDSLGRGRKGHSIGFGGLMELLAVVSLRDVGVSMQSVRRAVENLRELSGQERPLSRLTLVVVGKDVVWMDAEEIAGNPVSALQQPGQRLMLFPIGEQHNEFVQQLQSQHALTLR